MNTKIKSIAKKTLIPTCKSGVYLVHCCFPDLLTYIKQPLRQCPGAYLVLRRLSGKPLHEPTVAAFSPKMTFVQALHNDTHRLFRIPLQCLVQYVAHSPRLRKAAEKILAHIPKLKSSLQQYTPCPLAQKINGHAGEVYYERLMQAKHVNGDKAD